jgi:GNAT superfamily N-acetyltransferase
MPAIEEPDLAWLLAPPNETRMGLGVERQIKSLRGVKFPASTRLQRVRLYRDPYGSHRFVGFVAEVPVSGLQVMVNDAVMDAEGAPLTVVANVWTDPRWRGRGAAGDLYALARRVLGPVRHSRHLSESGARFAARNRAAASAVTFNRYRDLPLDPYAGSPLAQYGQVHAASLGEYWTVPVNVPLIDLSSLRAMAQSKSRLTSIRNARLRGVPLPPIEIAVYQNGSGWIVDGNHRLVDARKAQLASIPVRFTFGE